MSGIPNASMLTVTMRRGYACKMQDQNRTLNCEGGNLVWASGCVSGRYRYAGLFQIYHVASPNRAPLGVIKKPQLQRPKYTAAVR